MSAQSTESSPAGLPAWVLLAAQILSAALAGGIVLQAYLGTSGMFLGRENAVRTHELLGNLVFLLGLGLVVCAFLITQRQVLARTFLIAAIVILVLVVSQIGLGYAGRTNMSVRTMHITNGVLLMGACTWGVIQAFTPVPRRAN